MRRHANEAANRKAKSHSNTLPGRATPQAKGQKVQKAQAAGVKVGLKETKNKGKAKHRKYGETRDEEDLLYGDAAAE